LAEAVQYLGEAEVFRRGVYNTLITAAVFMDVAAFDLYWAAGNGEGRSVVDSLFNCEDILMNFVLAAASSERNGSWGPTVAGTMDVEGAWGMLGPRVRGQCRCT
jgi:hypothetical protein